MFAVGPELQAIIPFSGSVITAGQILHTAPTQLTLQFDQALLPSSLTNNGNSNVVLMRGGNDRNLATSADNVFVSAGYVEQSTDGKQLLARFDQALPDDNYQLIIVSGPTGIKGVNGEQFHGGQNLATNFTLDLGAQVVAVVPQPVTRNAAGKLQQDVTKIDVYFNANDPLNVASATTRAFYQLIRTGETATTADDSVVIPDTVVYDPTTGKATLTFPLNAITTTGTYRLRIGNDDPTPVVTPGPTVGAGAAGSSFATSMNLGQLFPSTQGVQSIDLSGAGAFIGGSPVQVTYPGSPLEPGARDPAIEDHVPFEPNTSGVIPIKYFYFPLMIGQSNSSIITPDQEQRAREIVSYYSHYLGVEFREAPEDWVRDQIRTGAIAWQDTLAITTGDTRALYPNLAPSSVGSVSGYIPDPNNPDPNAADIFYPTVIVNSFIDWGASEAGGRYFSNAMQTVGFLLGLGYNYQAPGYTVMGGDGANNAAGGEPVFPGDYDILYGRYLLPPVGNDINTYRFELPRSGTLSLETFANRLSQLDPNRAPSELNTVITLFDSAGRIVARNDDYYGNDSFLQLQLSAGVYFVTVTSTGNTNFDPTIADTGAGGTTQGGYQLRMSFSPTQTTGIIDAGSSGTLLDGDADGTPGGTYDFWFRVNTQQTVFVDKAAKNGTGAIGSLSNPYTNLATALAAAGPGSIVRIVGNGGDDGNLATLDDNLSYNIGFNSVGGALSDGTKFEVPRGVTVMIDAGAIFKMRAANIDVGSSAQGIDRSAGALQVLGTPVTAPDPKDPTKVVEVGSVFFTSYYNVAANNLNPNSPEDDPIGLDKNQGPVVALAKGNWGGIVFREDSDREAAGIFLNYVNKANLRWGGGQVVVNSVAAAYEPINAFSSRPTITYNTIINSAHAAMSADPNSFEESNFQSAVPGSAFRSEYTRVGPDIHDNILKNNTLNGLFFRIRTNNGSPVDRLTVPARLDDTDIVYILEEVLTIQGIPGGNTYVDADGKLQANVNARLAIDPGIIMKLNSARIETQIGAQLIAEGTADKQVIFTSVFDDRYGAGGTSDTTNDGTANTPTLGDWGGLFFGPLSIGSVDHALIAFGGGTTTVEGGFDNFDAVEIHQADVRVTNSTITFNLANGGGNRSGRQSSDAAAIFVRGAQPVLVNNIISNNAGAAISINVNSLNSDLVSDWGRSTGRIDIQGDYFNNSGALVRNNRVGNNAINGMRVRGGTLTVNGVWDDTDIVHVVTEAISVGNQQSLTGTLRLQSSPTESLVVKLLGITTGLLASGQVLDIPDRTGGALQLVGSANYPVVLTTLRDDTVGAGLTPEGTAQKDTRNTKGVVDPAPPNLPTSGPVILDGANRDAHGEVSTSGTLINGWVALRDEIKWVYDNSKNKGDTVAFPTTILALGVHTPEDTAEETRAYRAITTVAQKLGLQVNYVRGSSIAGVNFADYPLVYIPSDWGKTVTQNGVDVFQMGDVDGGILPSELANINTTALINYVNNLGGGLLSMSERVGGNYSWANLAIKPSGGNVLTQTAQFPSTLSMAINNGLPWLHSFIGPSGFNRLQPWLVDPATGEVAMLGNAPGGPGIGPSQDVATAGDWGSVVLDAFSNDYNAVVVNETEQAFTSLGDTNRLPTTAQALGELAKDDKSGDDNVRLGFEIHGAISQTTSNPGGGDVDVYSFRGTAGTSVWLDIDRTASALDSVVELVDANGAVIARSNDSLRETTNNSLLVGSARPLQVGAASGDPSVFSSPDFFSTNPLDAGMRVSLPGTAGTVGTYFVRVRSNSSNLNNLTGGLTRGAYVLQVRLQETDIFPGSVVQNADVRYAIDGISVLGKPEQSPLLGTSSESNIVHNSPQTAQYLGNLLQTDKNTITISGSLPAPTTTNPLPVDWFSFQLNYDLVQKITGTGQTFASMFQINYADGLARPDTTISVYVPTLLEDGVTPGLRLVLFGRDSDIVDSLPRPGLGADLTNLEHGSFGTSDPTIGSVQLPAGAPGGSTTYFVAVSSAGAMPSILNATFTGAAVDPLVRLEPIDSVRRVVEDHIGTDKSTTSDPSSNQIFTGDLTDPVNLANYQSSFTLNDMVLYVNTSTGLFTVNPFTGALTSIIRTGYRTANGGIGIFGVRSALPGTVADDGSYTAIQYHDIAMRGNGQLYTLTQGDTAANSGNFRQLSTSDGSLVGRFLTPADTTAVFSTDDGITTSSITQVDPAGIPQVTYSPAPNRGIQFDAMSFITFPDVDPLNGRTRLFAIGHRRSDDLGGLAGNPNHPTVDETKNLLFELDPDTGIAFNSASDILGGVWLNLDANTGSGTSHIPLGNATNLPGNITGLAADPQDFNTMYAVSDAGNFIKITNFNGAVDNAQFSIVPLGFPGAPKFTGLTMGPSFAELGLASVGGLGPYSRTLFATDINGTIYAFDLNGNPQNIFLDGRSSINLSNIPQALQTINFNIGDVQGLAFGTNQFNLWHPSTARATDPGHGINPSFDVNMARIPRENDDAFNSRLIGGASFYFGMDSAINDITRVIPGGPDYAKGDVFTRTANGLQLGNTQVLNSYGVPGGAYGSITSNTFNLQGYSAADKPVLYFNYFINTGSGSASRPDNEGVKVYASTDGVTWKLLATTNTVANNNLSGVQQLYKNSTIDGLPVTNETADDLVWRQARIELNDFAGKANVQLRFDFSSSGSMGSTPSTTPSAAWGTGKILGALPGSQLHDGDQFTLSRNADGTAPVTFTFRSGFELTAPAGGGRGITDGEIFRIAGIVDVEFDKDGVLNNAGALRLPITDAMTPEDIADAIFAAVSAIPGLPTGAVSISGDTVRVASPVAITNQGIPQPAPPGLIITGSPFPLNLAPTDIPFTSDLSSQIMAGLMAQAIDRAFTVAGAVDDPLLFTSSKLDLDTLRIFGHAILNAGPLPSNTGTLEGDGGGFTSTGSNSITTVTPHPGDKTLPAIPDETYRTPEGVYIDDLIVGFASRGEMVTYPGGVGSDIDEGSTFVATPSVPGAPAKLLSGVYQLNIRRGESYGFSSGDVITIGGAKFNGINLFQSFDVNDRLAQGFTLSVPSPTQVHEGQSFAIDDGSQILTFEYRRGTAGQAPFFDGTKMIIPLSPRVANQPAETATSLAQKIATAINMAATSTSIKFKVRAASTGAHVDLFDALDVTQTVEAAPNSVVNEREANNSLATAQSLDGLFNKVDDPIIGPTIGVGSVLTASLIPHVTVRGTGNGTFDYYSFTITQPGQVAAFDIDSTLPDGVNQIDTQLFLYDQAGNLLEAGDDSTPTDGAGGSTSTLDPYFEHTFAQPGKYIIGVARFNSTGAQGGIVGNPLLPGDRYSLNVSLLGVANGAPLGVRVYNGIGDKTPKSVQGQTVISGSKVSNSREVGILVRPVISPIIDTHEIWDDLDSEQQIFDANGSFLVGSPGKGGAVANLPTLNSARLVPGITIKNNLIVNSGRTGIELSGSPNNDGYSQPAYDVNLTQTPLAKNRDIVHEVPFARAINNTIYGGRVGIASVNGANPTIINNIIANADVTAIFNDGTAVIGNNLYQNNAAGNDGSQAIVLAPNEPLFVDAPNGNFYLKAGSRAIDSSVNSVQDRTELVAVTSPLGIPQSPIQAPDLDLLGQLRVDDPSVPSPPGAGSNVFKDRGAVERADFIGPTVALLNPIDNDSAGSDRDPSANNVTIVGRSLTDFTLQLRDGAGVGIDDFSVNVNRFHITKTVGATNTVLVPGVDYTLAFDTNSKTAVLAPAQGVWERNAKYTITLDNGSSTTPIRDLAGNVLQNNDVSGVTQFVVNLTDTTNSPWQNPGSLKEDVNNSGFVSGIDALLIINKLLLNQVGPLPTNGAGPPYYDVTGDGNLTSLDLLRVINKLNAPTNTLVASPQAQSQAATSPDSGNEIGGVIDTNATAVGLTLAQQSDDAAADSDAETWTPPQSVAGSYSLASASATQAAAWESTLAEDFSAHDEELDSILDDLDGDLVHRPSFA